jgi:pyrophosphatase PpaX
MSTKNYTAILFDWDGCLAKTLQIWLNAYKDTFKKHGFILDDNIITTQVFGNWQAPEQRGVKNIEEFHAQLMEKVNHDIKQVDLYEGAKELLLDIKSQKRQLALTSTSLKEFILPALKKHRLLNVFDLILDRNSVNNHKPHPEMIFKAIEQSGASKDSTIIIGDTKNDLGAAQSAGIDSVLFYPEEHERFHNKANLLKFNPTYIAGSFDEVRKILINTTS